MRLQYLARPDLFKQIHTHTDVRLGLGWLSVLVAGGTALYGYKVEFEQSKKGVWAGLILCVDRVMDDYHPSDLAQILHPDDITNIIRVLRRGERRIRRQAQIVLEAGAFDHRCSFARCMC